MAANQGMKEAQQMLRRIERSGAIYTANQSVAPTPNRQLPATTQKENPIALSNGKRVFHDKERDQFITENGEALTDLRERFEALWWWKEAKEPKLGQNIYQRAFGRGCAICHEMAATPQLTANIKAGTLDRARFETTIREGKGSMPKAIDAIMSVPVAPIVYSPQKTVWRTVKSLGYSEAQALDALWAYLSNSK